MTDEDKAAEKLIKLIHDVQEAQKAQGVQLEVVKTATEAAEAGMLAIRQAQDAQARAAVERSVAGGTTADLDLYVSRSAPAAQDRGNYRTTDKGAVRLTGHIVKHRDAEGTEHDVWLPGLADDPTPKTAAQLAFQRAVTRRSLARQVQKPGKRFTPQLDHEVIEAARALGGVIPVEKILADAPGIGASWVPDVTIPDVEREILLPVGLVGLFARRVLNGASLVIPRIAGVVRFYIHRVPTQNDPAADPLSNLTDGAVTIDTVSSAGGVQFDRDWAEDAIIAVLPEIQTAIIRGWRWAEDDSIMNGDKSTVHQDAIAIWNPRGQLGGIVGLGTTIDHRRRWDGLRARGKDAQVVTGFGASDQGAAATFAGMRASFAKIGAANMMSAQGSGSVVAITSWEYFFGSLLSFPEFASWEKIGALASILSGQLGNVAGTPGGILPGQVGYVQGMVPVVIASAMTADLASSGLYTGAGATTGMVTVDRSRFEYVVRKNITLEQETDIRNNTTTVVARGRTNFRPLDPTPTAADGVRDVHYSFNLPTTVT